MSDLAAHLRLVRTETVGPASYRRLLLRHGSPEAALEAVPALARASGGVAPKIPSPQAIADEIGAVQSLGGCFLVLGQAGYPPMLAQLADAPPVLAVLGDATVLQRRSIAIVGSRNASSNGLRIAEALAAELGDAGLVVVSGLARGIDGAAHLGAMHVGPTVACIAGGLDQPYPPEHAAMQARIAGRGAVVAEAPFGTVPTTRHFPRRNRIIAGLSLGCLVIEAALRSGSLITADLALSYGRELFAVPGSPLDPRCKGSNHLLRQRHAYLVENAADVIRELPASVPELGVTGFAEEPAAWGLESPMSRDGERPTSWDAERPISKDAERLISENAERPISENAERPASWDSERPISGDAERPASKNAEPPISRRAGAEPTPAGGAQPWSELDPVRRELLGLISPSPVPVDDLLRRCQFSAGAVLAVLTELELGGLIESLPGNQVSRLGPPLQGACDAP